MLRAFNLNMSYHIKEVKYMIVLFKYTRCFYDEIYNEEHLTYIPDIPEEGVSSLNEEDLWWFLLLDRGISANSLRILEIEYVED